MSIQTERLQFLKDVIVLAIGGGGCSYWANSRAYKPDTGHVMLLENDSDSNGIWREVSIDTIAEGCNTIKDPKFRIRTDLRKTIWFAELTNDISDIDIEAADCIVQAGLFGELTYG